MNIDKGSFFILAFTLAAGGVGGFYASERHVFRPLPPPPAPPPPPAAPAVSAATIATPPPPPPKPAPTCDDMVGSPAACPPPVWPADEGMPGCGTLPTKRCEDFKKAMKPRVAERAVACINALNTAQRCDPNRLELCGHEALMGACSIEEPPSSGTDAGPDEVGASCSSILRGCEGISPGPTMRDCRATLSGMSVLGRDRMAACMKTHCNDRGLLFCEAQVDLK